MSAETYTPSETLLTTREALDAILDWALANRGTEHEFVNFYTYSIGKTPRAILDAKAALASNDGDHSIEGLEGAYSRALDRVHELEGVIRALRSQVYAIQDSARDAIKITHMIV